MHKKISKVVVNVLPIKCSSIIHLVIYFILLCLVINTIGTFANGEPNENFFFDGKKQESIYDRILKDNGRR